MKSSYDVFVKLLLDKVILSPLSLEFRITQLFLSDYDGNSTFSQFLLTLLTNLSFFLYSGPITLSYTNVNDTHNLNSYIFEE